MSKEEGRTAALYKVFDICGAAQLDKTLHFRCVGHTDQPNPNPDLNLNSNLAAYAKRPATPPTASVGLGLGF